MENTKCSVCSGELIFSDEDISYYKKIGVPSPGKCPECRLQRRLLERNTRNLYYRKCDLTGKQIISQYDENVPFPVYEQSEWFSDKWDGLDFGKDIDFSKPFFEQFSELKNKVPHFATFVTPNSLENSDFTNSTGYLKNCYLIFESDYDEDCYYSNLLKNCKDIVDGSINYGCELCYECIDCRECYNTISCQDCSNCRDSLFLKNCKGCHDCIGCINQTQKSHMIFNQQLSPEEFAEKKKEFYPLTTVKIKDIEKRSEELFEKAIYKYRNAENVENSTGDHIYNCKNAKNCFDSQDLEDCAYCARLSLKAKDCMDYNSWGDKSELVYSCSACGDNAYNIKFCSTCTTNVRNIEYCHHCTGCSDCFGCMGLKKKQFCILNKQYSEQEYRDLRTKLIDHMAKTGEWGKYFPVSMSPFGYNETIAMDYFPLTKEEALAKGYLWKDVDQKEYAKQTYQVPEIIDEVDEKITSEILACKTCGRNYKIIAHELVFYKNMKLPIPENCPNCRNIKRVEKRNPAKLFKRQCMCEQNGHDHEGRCKNEFETTYAPERPEKIFCESCYQKEVI